MELLVKTCKTGTNLCIATDLTLESEYICTHTIAEWKNNIPDLNKRPTVFLIGNPNIKIK